MPQLYDHSREESRRAYPLERGWVKYKLIRELATNVKTQAQLAEEYGVSDVSISKFKTRHLTEVNEVTAQLEDEFAALWLANKASRIAELQADIDNIGDSLDPDLLKAKHAAIRNAAEELGQLPSRYNVQVNNAPVTYRIDGVDMDQLR